MTNLFSQTFETSISSEQQYTQIWKLTNIFTRVQLSSLIAFGTRLIMTLGIFCKASVRACSIILEQRDESCWTTLAGCASMSFNTFIPIDWAKSFRNWSMLEFQTSINSNRVVSRKDTSFSSPSSCLSNTMDSNAWVNGCGIVWVSSDPLNLPWVCFLFSASTKCKVTVVNNMINMKKN